MKHDETLLNTPADKEEKERIEALGDSHVAGSYETPLRPDAFEMDDELKMELIAKHFREIMVILGLDLEDDSLKGTPWRVAKMYVQEIFSGLNPTNEPDVKLFDNKYKYKDMILEKGIHFHSACEHHFVPIVGKAHVAYFSSGKVVGLSKMNRIVHYFARRPQVQERLTIQIAEALKKALDTDDVAVLIEAEHMCISSRGVQDQGSTTVTSEFSGKFREDTVKQQFLQSLKD